MTVVKELNELAYKMTGVNPKAKTDQQALNYIEQHYQGGQPSPTPTPISKFDYIIPKGIDLDSMSSGDEIEDSDILNVLNEIKTELADGLKPIIIGLYYLDGDGNTCFSLSNAIQYYYDLEKICFVTNTGINLSLVYNANKWRVYQN